MQRFQIQDTLWTGEAEGPLTLRFSGMRKKTTIWVSLRRALRRREAHMAKIHRAAGNGDDSILARLLDAGEDIHAREALTGRTPLHLAAANAHLSTVSLLIGRGVDLDARANSGETALHAAGSPEVASALLAAGADGQARAKGAATPLHTHTRAGRTECVRALLDADVPPDTPTEDGTTPLHDAALLGRAEIVRILLARGADPSARNTKGSTPLDVARAASAIAGKGAALAAELLQSAGAERQDVGLTQSVREDNARRRLAKDLIDAVTADKVEAVLELLGKGYDANLDDGDLTALHHAVARELTSTPRISILEALIEHDGDVNRRTRRGLARRQRDKRWETGPTLTSTAEWLGWSDAGGEGLGLAPLDLTAMFDDAGAATLLIRAGADVNAAGQDGETALHLCALYGAASVARTLIEAGADVDARTDTGMTPLGWASRRLASPGLRREFRLRVEAVDRVLRDNGGTE